MVLADAHVPVTRPRATPLRLGTRGSMLAVVQSTTIAEALRAMGAEVELVTVRTLGDDRPPDTTWGEGAFVGALEAALLDGIVDLAVHSAKDVPTKEHPRLTIAAYPRREDPRDAIVGREPGATLDGLAPGARVGTDSPRRGAFLRAIRPDLQVHPLHGNVDSRLRRLDAGETDTLVLAVAGLTRLGRADRIGQVLPEEAVPPAPGQGALAIQCRVDDDATRAWLARLDDPDTRAAVEAERALLDATGGGCRAPIGALGRVDGDEIVLMAAAARPHASDAPAGRPSVARGQVRGLVADRLTLAADLAAQLTAELAGLGDAAASPVVLVTRASPQADRLASVLEARGLRPVAIPTIEVRPVEPGHELDAAVLRAEAADWIVVTSANGASATLDAAARLGIDLSDHRWAAVGSATAGVLTRRGIAVAFQPSTPDGETLAAELPLMPDASVLLPRADIADGRLVDALAARGAKVRPVVAYRTIEAPEASRDQLRALFAAGGPGAIVFTSGSTVRGLATLLGASHLRIARRTLACCIGDTTASAARHAGFERVLVSPTATADGLADRIGDALDSRRTTSTLVPTEEEPT